MSILERDPGLPIYLSRRSRAKAELFNHLTIKRSLFFRRFGYRFNPDTSQILVSLKKIISRALQDFQEIIHRRNFLELFGQEPLQEIDRNVIILLPSQSDQPVDLLSDVNFLIERKLYRVARRLEL